MWESEVPERSVKTLPLATRDIALGDDLTVQVLRIALFRPSTHVLTDAERIYGKGQVAKIRKENRAAM